ncbi:hypothetical protein BDR07DRAFT_1488463 [Suillus spraguei]|nr:hypothetical protein BDR07DRAFT_1488463 [Suillus spraguei]
MPSTRDQLIRRQTSPASLECATQLLQLEAPQPPSTVSETQQATTNVIKHPVYTPGSEVVATPGGGLPVVVWIRGGGHIEGAASEFNGADQIIDSNYGIISVIVQYRFGLFGFLPGKAAKEGGALNVGLRT